MPKEHNGDRRSDECLAEAIHQLAHSILELGRQLQNQTALCRVEQKVDQIMASQVESAAELRTANAQLRKLVTDTAGYQGDVDALKAKIVELETLVASGSATQQELVDAIAETKTLAQTVDDNIPELTPLPAPA